MRPPRSCPATAPAKMSLGFGMFRLLFGSPSENEPLVRRIGKRKKRVPLVVRRTGVRTKAAWEYVGEYARKIGRYTEVGGAVTPEHWKRVGELFEAAVEQEP